MRRTIAMFGAAGTAVLAGCGGGAQFANLPRPAPPLNLTVYINDNRVSVSPTNFGAGMVALYVTNAGRHSQSLQVQQAGGSGGQPLADTGPISPQATAIVKVSLRPGDYLVATGTGGTEAQQASPSSIVPAQVHVGAPRPSGSNLLLQP